MADTWVVRVLAPCACEACRDSHSRGWKWWRCRTVAERTIAEYDAPTVEDEPAIPTRAALDWIRAAHPGAWLIY